MTKSIKDDDFSKIIISAGAHELESLNAENKRTCGNNGHFTEANYPFQIKPNFSTLGSIIENSSNGSRIAFTPNDSIRDLLGFKPKLNEEYNLSEYPVDFFII